MSVKEIVRPTVKVKLPKLTVTDILRVAVHMSGGDISLPKVPHKYVRTNRWSSHKSENPEREKFKFKSFSRPERRIILSLLEKTNCDASEAILKAQRWVKLGHSLHAGEYKKQFPKAVALFETIRNKKVQSWYGKVNEAFANSFNEGIKILSQRPGEFVRRLDWLLRKEVNASKPFKGNILNKYATKDPHVADSFKKLSLAERVKLVLDVFKVIAPKVSNKVLYEVYNHFENRYDEKTGRTIMVKGSRKRTTLPNLPAIPAIVIESVQRVVVEALLSKFAALPKLGKVYVDEKLKDIPMPTNMRSTSSTLRPTVRGVKMPIGNQNAKVIRAFVHWFDERGNEDIDLSGIFIGKNKIDHIGWNGRHNSATLGCYSGDIRHVKGACAEYIDINVKAALSAGFQYCIVTAHNYNGRSFETVKDCVVGTMEREHAQSGAIFKPDTIANCIQLKNEASTTIVGVIDLSTFEYIHLDIDSSGIPVASANFGAIMKAIEPYCKPPKFSVYDLVLLHAKARGAEIVDAHTKADEYFIFEDFCQDYVKTLLLMGV